MKNPKLRSCLLLLTLMVLLPLFSVSDWNSYFAPLGELFSFKDLSSEQFSVLNMATGEVVEMSAYEYVCGAVACEMAPTYPKEALKAQAVSSLTYALYCRDQQREHPDSGLKGADFSADFSALYVTAPEADIRVRYADHFDAYWALITEAVDEAAGQALFYDGKPALTPFFTVSSGNTEACRDVWGEDLPYLISVPCQWDQKCPQYRTATDMTLEEIEEKCGDLIAGGKVSDNMEELFSDIQRSDAGGILSASVCGIPVKGTDLRSALGLSSTNFTVKYHDGVFTFVTLGQGHGVGMSQYAARCMAEEGQNYDQILQYFFPGTILQKEIEIS